MLFEYKEFKLTLDLVDYRPGILLRGLKLENPEKSRRVVLFYLSWWIPRLIFSKNKSKKINACDPVDYMIELWFYVWSAGRTLVQLWDIGGPFPISVTVKSLFLIPAFYLCLVPPYHCMPESPDLKCHITWLMSRHITLQPEASALAWSFPGRNMILKLYSRITPYIHTETLLAGLDMPLLRMFVRDNQDFWYGKLDNTLRSLKATEVKHKLGEHPIFQEDRIRENTLKSPKATEVTHNLGEDPIFQEHRIRNIRTETRDNEDHDISARRHR